MFSVLFHKFQENKCAAKNSNEDRESNNQSRKFPLSPPSKPKLLILGNYCSYFLPLI